MRRIFFIASAVAMAVALTACAGCSTNQVRITNSGFNAVRTSTTSGTTVTWTNEDGAPHTVTTDDFDSGAIYPGKTYSHGFDVAGEYTYFCRYHPSETGKVTVR